MISSHPLRSVSLEASSLYPDEEEEEEEEGRRGGGRPVVVASSEEELSLWQDHGRTLFMNPYDQCGSPTCLRHFDAKDNLQVTAAHVVAKTVNRYLTSVDGLIVAVAYLKKLSPHNMNCVIHQLSSLRPRFLPLEYHWAPTEKDPFLSLVQSLPYLLTFSYIPHPLCQPHMESILCIHTRLEALSLPELADDVILRMLGALCMNLDYIDVSRSKAVTDCGLRRLLLKSPAASRFHWRHLYRRWRELRTTVVHSSSSSPAYHPLFVASPSSPLEAPSSRTRLCGSLRHLDLRGTRISSAGGEWAARRLKIGAHVLLTPLMSRNYRRLRSSDEEVRQRLLTDI